MTESEDPTDATPSQALTQRPAGQGGGPSQLPFACVTNNGAITITKYVEPGGAVVVRDGLEPLLADFACETVSIPGTINGLPVTGIGRAAFLNCTRLSGVTIPDGVTEIADSAFRGCSRLASLTIPKSVTALWANAFADCAKLTSIRVEEENPVYRSSEGGVVFSKDMTRLVRYPSGKAGAYTIPGTVTDIANDAFVVSRALTAVDLSAGVTNIGPWAFADCTSLTRVNFSGRLSRIGEFAFWGCSALPEVTIPESVTDLAYFTFAHCRSLNAVAIPRSVTVMGPHVFRDCSALTNIAVDAENPAFSSEGGVLFDKQKTRLIGFPCGRSGGYTLPNGVTQVEQSAFRGAGKVTCLRLPASVTFMGYKAFKGCSAASGFFFDGNAPGLRRDVFAGCSRSTIYYQAGATGWGKDFGGRPTAVWDPESPFVCTTNKGALTLAKYVGPEAVVAIPDSISGLPVTAIGNFAFQNCTHLAGVTVPKTVSVIGPYAFRNCSGLARVTLSDGVASIADQAFNGCSSLAGIALPASVARIGATAFINCSSLTSLVADAASAAYRSEDGVLFNKDLTALVCCPAGKAGNYSIPPSVTNIGAHAFESCGRLTGVDLPPGVAGIGSWGFARCSSLARVTLPERVTALPDHAFSGCAKLAAAGLPSRLTAIGAWAFQDCVGLATVALPASVADIRDGAFWHCPGLTRVALPASVKQLSGSAFAHSYGLASIDVEAANPVFGGDPGGAVLSKDKTTLVCCPAGTAGKYAVPACVTNIGTSAFEGCVKVTEIVQPSSVSSVGNYAFKSCSGLTNIVLSAKLTGLGVELFRDCLCLTDVTVPPQVASIGDRAFRHCPKLKALLFAGDAPRLGRDVFQNGTSPTVYYRPGTAGWGQRFGGLPTAVWLHPKTQIVECMNMGERQKFIEALRRAVAKSASPSSDSASSSDSPQKAAGSAATKKEDPFAHLRKKGAANVAPVYISVDAETECWEGYSYIVNGGKATITAYAGPGGDVTIPATIKGAPVTEIGNMAFLGRNSLVSVTIPSGVTRIGSQAFYGCASLSRVALPASVTSIGGCALQNCPRLTALTVARENPVYCSEDGVLFVKDKSELIQCSGGKAGTCAIPDSVTSILDGAFEKCPKLTALAVGARNPAYSSQEGILFDKNRTTLLICPEGRTGVVSIPAGVTNIAEGAFSDCTGLTDVAIPASVTDIGEDAFLNCTNLTAATRDRAIYRYAHTVTNGQATVCANGRPGYVGAPAVTPYPAGALTVPSALGGVPVTAIGRSAFYSYHTDSLKAVTLPGSVARMDELAFGGCAGLKAIYFEGNAPQVPGATGRSTIFYEAPEDMVVYVPAGSKGWDGNPESAALPESWQGHVIRHYTQAEKAKQLSVLMPEIKTEKVGDYRYSYAVLDGKAEIIGKWSAEQYRNINNVRYPVRECAVSPKPVGPHAVPASLGGCPVASIGDRAFSGCGGMTSVTIPDGVASIGENAFRSCSALTAVALPESVTSIGKDAFWFCSQLASVALPKRVESIGEGLFSFCTSLAEVTVDTGNPRFADADGVLYDKAVTNLLYCPQAKQTIVLPASVTSIPGYKFQNYKEPASLSIPKSVTSIDPAAFLGWSGLTVITVAEDNPSYAVVDGILYDKAVKALIRCPPGKTGACVIPPTVTVISNAAFADCDQLTSVTIPEGVTQIGGGAMRLLTGAFFGCSGLTEITIPASVTYLGYSSFGRCRSLARAYFKGNAPKSGNGTFWDTPATVCYLPGATGWGSEYDGRPTAVWKP